MKSYNCISDNVKLGKDVRPAKFTNLYGCEVGDETTIGRSWRPRQADQHPEQLARVAQETLAFVTPHPRKSVGATPITHAAQ